MEEIKNGRSLLVSSSKGIETAQSLISYCKRMIGTLRLEWYPPENEGLPFKFETWVEELLYASYKLSTICANNSKLFNSSNLTNPYISILFFAATQLKQLDAIIPIIDQIVQNITSPDCVLLFYLVNKQKTAVSLILEAFSIHIKDSTLLSACFYLAQSIETYEMVLPSYLDRLSQQYSFQVTILRAAISVNRYLISNDSTNIEYSLELIMGLLSDHPQNHLVLFNLAYLYALKKDKENSFKYARQSLVSNYNHSKPLLLLIRILHSNCQYDAAIDIAKSSAIILDRWDKNIVIEAMFCAAEKGDIALVESMFKRLNRKWKTDSQAMSASVRLNLMLGKINQATDVFESWSSFDQQSSEFMFCYSQLCVAAQDYSEAEKFITFAIDLNPKRGEYHAALSAILLKRGKKDIAYQRAKFATEIDPKSLFSWVALYNSSPNQLASETLLKLTELRMSHIDLSELSFMLFPNESSISGVIE